MMVYYLSILFPTAICIVGALWLICKREQNIRSQNILIVGFLISSLLFLCTANYVGGNLDSSTYMWWDIIDSFATMAAIPSMYLYICSLICEDTATWKRFIWFIPTLIVGFGTVVLYLLMDQTEIEGYIQTVFIDRKVDGNYTDIIYKLHQFIGVEVYNSTSILQIVGISIIVVRDVRNYHRRLLEFYSDADEKTIYIDKKIIQWFLITIPLSFMLIIPDIEFWEKHRLLSSILFISWSMVYFALFYYGSQKTRTIQHFIEDLQQADLQEKSYDCMTSSSECEELNKNDCPNKNKQVPRDVFQRIVLQLEKIIDEEKKYLTSDLRIDQLSRLMCTNRVYVSNVIKEKYHCSFSDYINGKRIEFSMELMKSNPNLTQDVIAENSGFINAQSYSRTFKKMVGVPPKEWLKRTFDCQ